MGNGIPLTDEDRWDWLVNISRISTESALKSPKKLSIASCSALKKVYRDKIQNESPNTNFIYIFLYCSLEELIKRTELRTDHFMKSSMLKSQFDILEFPKNESTSKVIDVTSESVDTVALQAISYIDSIL